MAQDLNSLLKTLQVLNASARHGRVSREQLAAEVKKVTAEVKDALANLGEQLPPEAAGAPAMLVDLFKQQLGAVLQSSGLAAEETAEMRQLSEELDKIKRTHVKS